MTEGQRESLDALVRLAAEKAAAAMEASADASSPSAVADFLQVKVKARRLVARRLVVTALKLLVVARCPPCPRPSPVAPSPSPVASSSAFVSTSSGIADLGAYRPRPSEAPADSHASRGALRWRSGGLGRRALWRLPVAEWLRDLDVAVCARQDAGSPRKRSEGRGRYWGCALGGAKIGGSNARRLLLVERRSTIDARAASEQRWSGTSATPREAATQRRRPSDAATQRRRSRSPAAAQSPLSSTQRRPAASMAPLRAPLPLSGNQRRPCGAQRRPSRAQLSAPLPPSGIQRHPAAPQQGTVVGPVAPQRHPAAPQQGTCSGSVAPPATCSDAPDARWRRPSNARRVLASCRRHMQPHPAPHVSERRTIDWCAVLR